MLDARVDKYDSSFPNNGLSLNVVCTVQYVSVFTQWYQCVLYW